MEQLLLPLKPRAVYFGPLSGGTRRAVVQAVKPHTPPSHSAPFPIMSIPRLSAAHNSLFPLFRVEGLQHRWKDSDIMSDSEPVRHDERRIPSKRVTGIFWILLLNIVLFLSDYLFKIREIKSLYLYHNRPAWYQFVTAEFCHASWNHLSSNMFFLYIFGKLVEEEEGSFALWVSYIVTGAGANLISWLVLPKFSVSVGASGAVFGLFVISVLVKMSWDWRKLLEVCILGQFVIEKIMEAAQLSAGLAGPLGRGYYQNVNHVAHLSGALIGAALVFLIRPIISSSPI